jgi:crotonobetainyl-CoA:carnitine CoA-transferase CaiB-like acyl-CoA transferase
VSVHFLSGIRVVELSGEPLALAGRILADLGADVVLVEPPGGGPARQVPPLLPTPGGAVASPHFLATAAGKRSVTVSSETEAGHALLRRLLSRADVVLLTDDDEALQRRGLAIAELRADNERLIVASLTPYGRSGPRRRWKGSDLTAWASSGALMAIGDPDRRPLAPGGRLAYAAGSLTAVAGTVLALRARDQTGRGQVVDVSLQEAVLSVTGESGPFFALEGILGAPVARLGRRRGAAQGMYPAKDGLVELLPFMPGQWDALAEWIGEELGIAEATLDVFKGSVAVRAPFAEVIDGWVEALTIRYTKLDFLFEAQRRGIPCGAVNEPADLLVDPQLEAIDGWVHGEAPGTGPLRWPRPPLRFDDRRMGAGPVPNPGQDNQAVWGGELGLSADELAALRASRTV